jgi:ABC-type bacteriocin/lantibiotic exporter with double-glycine peptidase domain
MGYCIELKESTLVIRKEFVDDIIKSIKEFAKTQYSLTWVYINDILNAENIEDIFSEIGYELEKNENGDYEIDYFSGEKLGDDLKILNSFAKFIEDGQYIEMIGECGCRWRWVFDNGVCKEVRCKISYDD